MNVPIQLRRSALFVPGDNLRALEKAKLLPADALIFDLEDAVPSTAKSIARQQACAAVASKSYGHRELVIRINGRDTVWHADDIRTAAEAQPAAILLPKVERAADIHELESRLDSAGANSQIQIWAMLETPLGVLHAAEIACASPRLTVLVVGTNDLSMELGAQETPGREPLFFALSQCLLAARSAGKAILDGVYNHIADLAGFEAECSQARALGFDGKTVIHPNQLEICNRTFSPSEAEISRARA